MHCEKQHTEKNCFRSLPGKIRASRIQENLRQQWTSGVWNNDRIATAVSLVTAQQIKVSLKKKKLKILKLANPVFSIFFLLKNIFIFYWHIIIACIYGVQCDISMWLEQGNWYSHHFKLLSFLVLGIFKILPASYFLNIQLIVTSHSYPTVL
jgi:hypothetical protein